MNCITDGPGHRYTLFHEIQYPVLAVKYLSCVLIGAALSYRIRQFHSMRDIRINWNYLRPSFLEIDRSRRLRCAPTPSMRQYTAQLLPASDFHACQDNHPS